MPNNPCHLDGFAFLEFSGPSNNALCQQFQKMGFTLTKTHRFAPISLMQQGGIDFIINGTKDSQAAQHATHHGAGACAMGFKVQDCDKALSHALHHGATEFTQIQEAAHALPAIEGIGGSVIYFVDAAHQPFNEQWQEPPIKSNGQSAGLLAIDHLTHNVQRGNMDRWAEFYQEIFNFRQIRYFDIKGKMTGLISKAMGSPCGKIKIPLNESKDDNSQIEEFLSDYNGEGIQHIALNTADIIHSIQRLKQSKVPFLDVPDTYYEAIADRIPWHQEPIEKLQELKLLIDGEKEEKHGLLLQIFTENVFGPVFFEIIQRRGNDGFGEGNFQALFEAIERDQIRRGTLEIQS